MEQLPEKGGGLFVRAGWVCDVCVRAALREQLRAALSSSQGKKVGDGWRSGDGLLTLRGLSRSDGRRGVTQGIPACTDTHQGTAPPTTRLYL